MSNRTCKISNCNRGGKLVREMCALHYGRWRRHGSPLKTLRIVGNDEKRFWSKVEKTDTCWHWIGTVNNNGYGQFFIRRGKNALAHRWAYESLIAPIPSGLQIDHLCRNRGCVNPAHLEPVTPKTNVHRSKSTAGINRRKTHCKRGHKFTDANTYVAPGGSRKCRTCTNERARAYRAAPDRTKMMQPKEVA